MFTCPSIGKMEEVEHRVEEFIAGTHEEEERARGVVEAKKGILFFSNIFVGSLSQNIGSVEVHPMAAYVNSHDHLKYKDVTGVE